MTDRKQIKGLADQINALSDGEIGDLFELLDGPARDRLADRMHDLIFHSDFEPWGDPE